MKFQIHPRYRLLAVASLIMTGLFGWDLRDGADLGSIFFFAVSLGLFAWFAFVLTWRVLLESDRLTVVRLPRQHRSVEFRQVVDVAEEGRFGQSLLVFYHPKDDRGLVDVDDIKTLALPAVVDQDALRQRLVDRIPT